MGNGMPDWEEAAMIFDHAVDGLCDLDQAGLEKAISDVSKSCFRLQQQIGLLVMNLKGELDDA